MRKTKLHVNDIEIDLNKQNTNLKASNSMPLEKRLDRIVLRISTSQIE